MEAVGDITPEAQRYFEDYCPSAAEDIDMGDIIRAAKAALDKARKL